MPHGDLPTRIVDTTFSDAVSMTETSFEDPLAVYRNLPSAVSPMPRASPDLHLSGHADVARSMTETVRARRFATVQTFTVRRKGEPHGREPVGNVIVC